MFLTLYPAAISERRDADQVAGHDCHWSNQPYVQMLEAMFFKACIMHYKLCTRKSNEEDSLFFYKFVWHCSFFHSNL